jgi:predicted transcriptional regulator YheO
MDKKETFEFLDRIAMGIAKMFGSNCETLIHDMSVPRHPILAIYNGHVTNRKVGSTEDVYGDLANYKSQYLDNDFVNHLAVGKSGKLIKSTTFHVRGEDYHYALGINFDFTYMREFSKMQNDFIKVESDLQSAISEAGKNKLSLIFDKCLEAIGIPLERMTKPDRIRFISLLKREKVFTFQKSVPYVSKRLNVSRYTVYKYIKESD